MEPRFQTSFIPKKPLSPDARRPGHRVIGFFSLGSLIIFVSVIALSVGVFLYQQFLLQNISSMKRSLDRARAAFEPSLIAELKRLDSRIETVKKLIGAHAAATPVFRLLELNTLQNVRFSDFNYTSSGPDTVSITMKGEARSFSAIALQADLLASRREIRDPVFSNLTPDKGGLVAFVFSGNLDPRIVLYQSTLDNTAPASSTTANPIESTPETPRTGTTTPGQ